MNFPSEKDDRKKIEKNNVKLFLMFCMLTKIYIYILLMFQNITQIMKNKLFF